MGRKKNFGYGSLICSFFFERVPALAPLVSLPPSPQREPRMKMWTVLWYTLEGGPSCHYDEYFFDWWTQITFGVNEYYYTGMDYRGDLDLSLPTDAQWGNISMFFKFSMYINFLYFDI